MRLPDLISDGNSGTYVATESTVQKAVAKLEEYIERGDQRFYRATRIFHTRVAIETIITKGRIPELDQRAQALSDFYKKYFGSEPAWYVEEGVTIQRS